MHPPRVPAESRSGSSSCPWNVPLGLGASSCLGSLRAALGSEFPVASKGAQSQQSSQGARPAGRLAGPRSCRLSPTARRQKCEAALVSGLGGWNRAARSQALLGTVLAFPGSVNSTKTPQKPHAEQSLRGAAWKARGLERRTGHGGPGQEASSGPGNFPGPSLKCSPTARSQGPHAEIITHWARRGPLRRVSWPGVLQASCAPGPGSASADPGV